MAARRRQRPTLEDESGDPPSSPPPRAPQSGKKRAREEDDDEEVMPPEPKKRRRSRRLSLEPEPEPDLSDQDPFHQPVYQDPAHYHCYGLISMDALTDARVDQSHPVNLIVTRSILWPSAAQFAPHIADGAPFQDDVQEVMDTVFAAKNKHLHQAERTFTTVLKPIPKEGYTFVRQPIIELELQSTGVDAAWRPATRVDLVIWEAHDESVGGQRQQAERRARDLPPVLPLPVAANQNQQQGQRRR